MLPHLDALQALRLARLVGLVLIGQRHAANLRRLVQTRNAPLQHLGCVQGSQVVVGAGGRDRERAE